MNQVSNRIKGVLAATALLVPALYFKHAVRYNEVEIPTDVVHELGNGFDYYRFNSLTKGERIVRAHWRVDTPVLEPYAAEHYDEVKSNLDLAVEFNRIAYKNFDPVLGGELMVCDVNSYGYSIYPMLPISLFSFFKTKPFLQQHTHTNVARASCDTEFFPANSPVWMLKPDHSKIWYYAGE